MTANFKNILKNNLKLYLNFKFSKKKKGSKPQLVQMCTPHISLSWTQNSINRKCEQHQKTIVSAWTECRLPSRGTI